MWRAAVADVTAEVGDTDRHGRDVHPAMSGRGRAESCPHPRTVSARSRPSIAPVKLVRQAGQSSRSVRPTHATPSRSVKAPPRDAAAESFTHHGAVTHPRRRAAAHNGAVHRTQAQSLQHSISHTRHGPGPFLAGLLHAVPTILSARAVRTVPPVPPPAPRPTRVTARRPCTTPPRGPRVSTTRAPPGPGRRPQRAHRGPLRCRRPRPRPAGTTRTVPARESTHDRHRRRRHRAGT